MRALVGLILCALLTASLEAQKLIAPAPGLAWRVQGTWQAEEQGRPIRSGDTLRPGSLLQPGAEAANHSITVLLPDGQRILYECFTLQDCSRGFRIPMLFRRPEPFALDMLTRIHAVLVSRNRDLSTGPGAQHAPPLPRDEVMATLGPDLRVHVEGLAAQLPNGRYTYDLQRLDHASAGESRLVLNKTSPSITLNLPAPGLYDITLADDLNTPRIDLLIAAVKPSQAAGFERSVRTARKTMEEWNGDYAGWPIHEFERAYIEALVVGPKALRGGEQVRPATLMASDLHATGLGASGATVKRGAGMLEMQSAVMVRQGSRAGAGAGKWSASDEVHPAEVTAEPIFSPEAGLFAGDTAVTLRSDTQASTIHYTVDGSQPVDSSPIYQAPIVVKGTELTIKAFASTPGRKDSPVVTGIFRIRQ